PGPDSRHALGVVRLDDHQVIVELDDQAVMRRAGDAPHPLGEFLRRVPGRSQPPPSAASSPRPRPSVAPTRTPPRPPGGGAAASDAGAARMPTSPSIVAR